jgi:hypothetical protein
MIKLADFFAAYKEGKIKSSTMVKAAAFKDELEKASPEMLKKAITVNPALRKLVDFRRMWQAGGINGPLAESMTKTFGQPSHIPSAAKLNFGQALGSQLRKNVPEMLATGLVVGGTIMGLQEAVKAIEGKIVDWSNDMKKPKKFQELLELHPELKEKEVRAKLYYEALWNFSPTIADNPLSAGAYIKQALQYDHVAQGPLPASLSELTSIEKNVQQAGKDSKSESLMTTIMMPWKTPILGKKTND